MIPTGNFFWAADRAARIAFILGGAWIGGRLIFGVLHSVVIGDEDVAA